MRTLTLDAVINGLDLVIDDWGSDAKGGDAFGSGAIVDDAKWLGYTVKAIGFDPDTTELPICLVGTFTSEYLDRHFAQDNPDLKLTKDAGAFLDHVVAAVDGEAIYSYITRGFIDYPENPNRNWRLAYNRVLKVWGLA